MSRSVAVLLACGLLIIGSFAFAAGVAAATIAPTTTCNNNFGNGGAVCDVTVVNTITATGGSAVVTVHECQGSAGVPAATCTDTTDTLNQPVTAVNQCNDSVNGGGGQMRCSVTITNNFVGIDPAPTAVTVNQCVGSGESGAIGSTIVCDPFPATTTGATITQCNGTGNGGNLVGLTCTASGTQSAGLAVTINQCNGSTNGGGTLTVCSATIENNLVAGPTPTAGSTPRVTPPSTDTLTMSADASGTGLLQIVLMGIFLVALIVLVATLRAVPKIRS